MCSSRAPVKERSVCLAGWMLFGLQKESLTWAQTSWSIHPFLLLQLAGHTLGAVRKRQKMPPRSMRPAKEEESRRLTLSPYGPTDSYFFFILHLLALPCGPHKRKKDMAHKVPTPRWCLEKKKDESVCERGSRISSTSSFFRFASTGP